MAIFKCKMCGASLKFNEGASTTTCEYCATEQTIPSISDEKLENFFNRANHFRRSNDFDKAISAYENILNEDNTNAEAHWGIVLSKFGIEYVDDTAKNIKVPTCHRMQIESILTDEDYKKALEYAPDLMSKRVYEEQAKQIATIQKQILAISQKEEPFDVFICYKETDETGTRTKDSVLAQDIYYRLQEQGLKVFYSRLTLEKVIGQKYEPYIFAALNSAKVMVVLGTKTEYFSATWVKNEWSRYLKIVQTNREKIIIPCYSEIDAYELPDELMQLQSLDMSRIGFMQDLIHGITKVTAKPKDEPKVVVQAAASTDGYAPTVEPLLKRAFMFLEDGEFNSANEYFEKVLDMDPECAQAYIGKTCVDFKVTQEEKLGDISLFWNSNGYFFMYDKGKAKDMYELISVTINNKTSKETILNILFESDKQKISENKNYQKVIRFADDNYINKLNSYLDLTISRNCSYFNEKFINFINTGSNYSYRYLEICLNAYEIIYNSEYNNQILQDNKIRVKEHIYNAAVNQLECSNTSDQCISVLTVFKLLGDYEESIQNQELCENKIAYQLAVDDFNSGETVEECEEVQKIFIEFNNYKDSKKMVEKCFQKINMIHYNNGVRLYDSHQQISNLEKQIERIEEALNELKLSDNYSNSSIISNASTIIDKCLHRKNEIQIMIDEKKKQLELEKRPEKYRDALRALMISDDLSGIEYAAKIFEELGDYEDSQKRLKKCEKKLKRKSKK